MTNLDKRRHATMIVLGGVVSYVITLSFGVQSAIGSMLAVTFGAVWHLILIEQDRR